MRLALAHVVVVVAEWALWVVVLVYAYDRGGSSAAGLTSLVLVVPMSVAALFAGAAADGPRPGRALVAACLTITLSLAGSAIAAAAQASIAIVVGCSAVAVGATAFVRPCLSVITPAIVHSARELTVANLWAARCESVGLLAGPLMASAMISLSGPRLAFAVCSGLGAVALLTTSPLASIGSEPAADDEPVGRARSLVDGVRALGNRPGVPPLLAVAGGQFVLIGALDLLYVVFAAEVLELGDAGPGLLSASFGVGALLTGVLSAVLVARARVAHLLIAALAAVGVGLITLGLVSTLVVALIVLPIAGFSRSLLDLTSRMLLQRSAPPFALASVFAALELLAGVGTAIGVTMAQLLVLVGGPRVAIAGLGGFFVVMLALTLQRLRRADESADVPVVAITLLRRLPIFSPLPAPALEAVARAAVEIDVPAGTVVIREGDEGDRFYAVCSGELAVTRGAEQRATVTRGGSFGEVALLAQVPRTASVTALTDSSLLVIDREPFLVAVTGHDRALRAAWQGVHSLELGVEYSTDPQRTIPLGGMVPPDGIL